MTINTETGVDVYDAAVADIEVIQKGLSDFWKDVWGWAPADAAALLDKSRLDWLPSLASTLHHWSEKDSLSDGELIVAWANLGSLLEGSLKLFLSAYLNDYQNDAEMLISLGVRYTKGPKKGCLKPPDELGLEKIRQFCEKRNILMEDTLMFVKLVQDRRNVIHAFKAKPLGTTAEFRKAVSTYRVFLAELAMQMPHPDDYAFHWLDLAGSIWIKARTPQAPME